MPAIAWLFSSLKGSFLAMYPHPSPFSLSLMIISILRTMAAKIRGRHYWLWWAAGSQGTCLPNVNLMKSNLLQDVPCRPSLTGRLENWTTSRTTSCPSCCLTPLWVGVVSDEGRLPYNRMAACCPFGRSPRRMRSCISRPTTSSISVLSDVYNPLFRICEELERPRERDS